MAWRGSTNIQDRTFSILVYLFAIYDSFFFGSYLFDKFPPLIQLILSYILFPIHIVYSLNSYASFIVFIILYLAVVRNNQIKHFIRYNALQSILIGILLSLLGLVIKWIFEPIFAGFPLLIQALSNLIFITSFGACLYAMFQSARGIYAELPVISKAAYNQLYY